MKASGLIRHFLIKPFPKAECTMRRRSTSFRRLNATWRNESSTSATVVRAKLIHENDYLVAILDLFDARFRNFELEADGCYWINFWSTFTMAVFCVSKKRSS